MIIGINVIQLLIYIKLIYLLNMNKISFSDEIHNTKVTHQYLEKFDE